MCNISKKIYDKITTDGLYTYNKTDLYDYLIYLLDKEKRLLDKSNDELSRLLKISPSKVSALRANISVKFMNDSEYESLFIDFLSQISNSKNIKEDETHYIFTIEDKAIRNFIEAKLKKHCDNTADYTLNKEKIKILKSDFITLLQKESDDDLNTQKLIKQLEAKNSLDKALGVIAELIPAFKKAKNIYEIIENN